VFTNRRVLEPVESRIMMTVGVALLTLAILFVRFPRVLVYPINRRFHLDCRRASIQKLQAASQ
jgi:hypothetical protein